VFGTWRLELDREAEGKIPPNPDDSGKPNASCEHNAYQSLPSRVFEHVNKIFFPDSLPDRASRHQDDHSQPAPRRARRPRRSAGGQRTGSGRGAGRGDGERAASGASPGRSRIGRLERVRPGWRRGAGGARMARSGARGEDGPDRVTGTPIKVKLA